MALRRLTPLLVLGAVLLAAAPAPGQEDTGRVLREIDTLLAKKKSIEARLERNIALKRSIESAFEELAAEDERLARESARIDAEARRISREIDNYNAYCSGTFEEAEYRVRKSWCDANEGPLQALIDKSDRDIEAYNAAVVSFNDRQQALIDQDNRRIAEARAMKREYDGIQMRLKALERILRLSDFARRNRDCAERPTLEDMHRCMQVIWDGAD